MLNKDNVEFLYECEVRSWYSECGDEWDALPTFEPWPGRSYVDVEQSCVTELDSCHACHGMREAEERRREQRPEKCCRGISFGNIILDEYFQPPI